MVTAEQLQHHLDNCLTGTQIEGLGDFYKGKVRDNYSTDDGRRILVTTDRQSAFDRNLGLIPLKSQALTQLSSWWFEHTKDIVKNHVIEVPDPCIVIGKNVKTIPIEMVIRGYLSGSTGTSSWMAYHNGERTYCGHTLPEGMLKNQKFENPLITPTTKDDIHDENIDFFTVVESGLVDPALWEQMVDVTYKLFERGQQLAAKGGLILVDTKYEFGVDEEGKLVLIDEIHTSDSSRFWKADTYQALIADGKEPENFDKEFLRLWFRDRCDPYNDENLPEMPDEFRIEVALRYIETYERITGEAFQMPESSVQERVVGVLEGLR
ncbi:MAG: phosphoribosylaminoimidazolesuccinocarboxamide synthase [Candidatus Gracilibacteria bacterium]|nr:phosphoribosylaminoimidazolesuccinocarboxamide synthase [Candidatus Gracilibacteria bacterium]